MKYVISLFLVLSVYASAYAEDLYACKGSDDMDDFIVLVEIGSTETARMFGSLGESTLSLSQNSDSNESMTFENSSERYKFIFNPKTLTYTFYKSRYNRKSGTCL